jgi:hypothetical protein
MTEPSDVVWGQFKFNEDQKLLVNVLSGQTIQLKQQGADACVFDYGDGEIETSIIVQQKGWQLFVDFRRDEMASVARTYGLWRRMAFFLPDSLMFWFFGGRSPLDPWSRSKVILVGGWQNGRWDSSLLVESFVFYPPDPKLLGDPQNTAIKLFPLNATPITWRFLDARHIAPEVKLTTTQGGDIPFLDRAVAIDKQIANAPRFMREDGGAVLFHRFVQVNFHRGEDYDPVPYYGYGNEHVAFTLSAQSNSGVSGYIDPLLVSWDAAPKDYFTSLLAMGGKIYPTLSLRLREELFFALLDIKGVRLGPGKKWPIIRERDSEELDYYRKRIPEDAYRWNGIVFGAHLHAIDGMPMRSPAGLAQTSFFRDLKHPSFVTMGQG